MRFTLFRDRFSRNLSRQEMPWHRFAHDIHHNAPEFPNKQQCPLISLTEYGDNLSMNGSYRHIENVIAVHGIEGDYDAGKVHLEEAYASMMFWRLKSLIITTPSHTPAAPRWRILMPLSQPQPIEARRGLVERLNGALHGILAPESATATQCFYIGKVTRTAHDYRVIESFGRCIDTADNIPSETMAIIERPQGAEGQEWKSLSRDEQYAVVHDAFINRDGRHEAARRLAVMMAQDGADAATIRAELIALMGTDTRSADGKRDLMRDINTFPEWAVRTIGAPKTDSMARADASLIGLLKGKK